MNVSSSSVCNLCGLGEHLYRCVRCRTAVYCSKEHQRQDWNVHKLVCVTAESKKNTEDIVDSDDKKKTSSIEGGEKWSIISKSNENCDENSPMKLSLCDTAVCSMPVASDTSQCISLGKGIKDEKESELNQICSSSQEYSKEDSKDLFGKSENPYPRNKRENLENTILEMGSVTLAPECSLTPETKWQSSNENSSCKQSENPYPPFLHRSLNIDLSCKEQLQSISMEWMSQICQYVVRDLEKYGICVVDNFMGKDRAEAIYRSVVSMYHSGVFVEGETVSSSLDTTKKVRSDKITWVDGSENNCANIAHLISTVDTIIMNSVRMKGNGQLGQRTIGGRTKAMIACYPGSGAHYVKHVDNPNRDGRCITTTYYCNKDWDAKTIGGLLRIFPQGWANQVVDIEPILDRMVFFWSDRRNPHEVQPAFRTRYAITVWYFDAKEREEARLRYIRERKLSVSSTVSQ